MTEHPSKPLVCRKYEANRTRNVEVRKLLNAKSKFLILRKFENLKSNSDRAPFKTPSLPKERSKSDKKCGS